MYLFFFRVLQATWSGSTTNVAVRRVTTARPGRSKKPKRPAAQPSSSLVVLEPIHLAGQQYNIMGETTIGRAVGCQISLDDTYMSQLHARISPTGSGLLIEDLGSTNGTYLNRQKVTAPVIGEPGDRVQLGGIVMELR